MNEDELAAGLAETPGYRYAEVEGDQLFVAGQVPLDSSGASSSTSLVSSRT